VALALVTPALPLVALTEDERNLVARLRTLQGSGSTTLDLLDAYYNGNQLIRDLGISIPPQVRGLHTVIGWPQTAVDAIEERLDVEGFRYASSADGDDELWGIWQDNNLDEESQLAHLDALIYGSAYTTVGSNSDGSALITVESARCMAAIWDPQGREITAALRVYGGDAQGRNVHATLYLRDETIGLSESGVGGWDVTSRDRHNLGEVPVKRMANRQRTHKRSGQSEITSQVMSITDAACRTLLGIEVSREYYQAPMRVVLGASKEDFVDTEGNQKSPWETYLGRMLALQRDDDGNLPDIKQLPAFDPSVQTRIIDMYTEIMAGQTRLPAYMLGKTSANPASADAIRSAQDGLIRRADRRKRPFGGTWEDSMRLSLRVQNNGQLPDGAMRIETLWASSATPTPGATTDAIAKQIEAGAVPATSDVTREKLGYSVIERQRLAIDDERASGDQALADIGKALTNPGAPSGPPTVAQ
jgi:hypothetical protein